MGERRRGREDGGREREDGRWRKGEGRFSVINCPMAFWGDSPDLRLVQIEFSNKWDY
jgi:hypothetical protein